MGRILRHARGEKRETRPIGAAFLAGIGTGVWAGTKEVAKAWKAGKRFLPKMKKDAREGHLDRWRKAIARVCA